MRNNVGTVLATPMITDDDAVVVDYLVARLNRRDAILGRALIGYFRDFLSYRQLAVRMACSKQLAELYMRSGVAWIDGHLEGAAVDMTGELDNVRTRG